MKYRFKIKRFDPETDKKPHWEDYTVEGNPDQRVLELLLDIKGFYAGSLALRYSCGHGICGSDAVVINGRTRLACKVIMKEFNPDRDVITVEAMHGYPIIKDLVVDMRLFFEHYKAVRPYLINDQAEPARERIQSQEERARIEEATRCILCGACTGSCPTFWANRGYLGPAAIVQASRFIFDSRDTSTLERLELLSQEGGVFTCRSIYNCSEACPRDIEVVRLINEVRDAIRTTRR